MIPELGCISNKINRLVTPIAVTHILSDVTAFQDTTTPQVQQSSQQLSKHPFEHPPKCMPQRLSLLLAFSSAWPLLLSTLARTLPATLVNKPHLYSLIINPFINMYQLLGSAASPNARMSSSAHRMRTLVEHASHSTMASLISSQAVVVAD